ncbi:MAG TPA: glycerophosphodiester phosphodiesterase [Ktedonobacteraceae bacterium]|jgi:glycerophosphoryl diester phosphodiesterase
MPVHLQRVAHRGGSHLAPENTMAAFRHALTMPIDAIELDVQMSRDGQAVIFHDNTIERLSDGEGNILDLDFAFLRSLNVAAHFSDGWPQREYIPTLREVLALVRNRVHTYIEMKASKRDGVHGRYPHIEEAVVREIRMAKAIDQVTIISFDWQLLHTVKQLEPDLETGVNVSADMWSGDNVDALIAQVNEIGCHWINMDYKLATEAVVKEAHRHHLKCSLWTVNALDEMRRLASLGVDALISDRPDLFAQISRN